jgi:hypothetical protein
MGVLSPMLDLEVVLDLPLELDSLLVFLNFPVNISFAYTRRNKF